MPRLVTPSDALQTRALRDLDGWLNWCARHGLTPYIGEVGWPNDIAGHAGDAAAYAPLAEAWYRLADQAKAWVTYFDCGILRPTYQLAAYTPTVAGQSLSLAAAQAAVIEAHPTAGAMWRGVNITSPALGAPFQGEATSSFSNANLGTYGTDWVYEDQASLTYLAGRGIRLVRLFVRWERIWPTIGAALGVTEQQRLSDMLDRCNTAGLRVVLTISSFGDYYRDVAGVGTKTLIGSAQLSQAQFNAFWLAMSAAYKAKPALLAYEFLNEPSPNDYGAAWAAIAQSCLDNLRANGDTTTVVMPYTPQSIGSWAANHPAPEVSDSAGKLVQTVHQYWDETGGGTYPDAYATVLADAQAKGYR